MAKKRPTEGRGAETKNECYQAKKKKVLSGQSGREGSTRLGRKPGMLSDRLPKNIHLLTELSSSMRTDLSTEPGKS